MALVTLRFRTLPIDVARFCKLLAGRNRLQAKLSAFISRFLLAKASWALRAQANKKTHRGTPVQQPFPLNKGRRPKVSAGPSSKKHRTHGRRIDSFSVVQIRYSFLCLKKFKLEFFIVSVGAMKSDVHVNWGVVLDYCFPV